MNRKKDFGAIYTVDCGTRCPRELCFDMYASGERNSSSLQEMVGLDNSEGLVQLDYQIS